MAGQNPDDKVADDDKKVTEEDLRKDKAAAEVESAQAEDETAKDETSTEESEETSEEDGKTDESQDEEDKETDETESDSSEFVKEFPNIKGDTLEEYKANLEKAYQNSFDEGVRLNKLIQESQSEQQPEETGPVDPRMVYVDRIINKDIQDAYDVFSKKYSQTQDPVEYERFRQEAASLNEYNLSKGTLLTGEELYPKVAAILGWEPNQASGQDRLGNALKDRASSAKTSSATKSTPRSKVTDEMVAVNRLMYPNKTDTEIRAELEPHVK